MLSRMEKYDTKFVVSTKAIVQKSNVFYVMVFSDIHLFTATKKVLPMYRRIW